MSTTSLVAEFLVIGTIPFMTLVFTILSITGIYDFNFLSKLKENSAAVVILTTPVVYLLGTITHRLGQMLNRNSMAFFSKRVIKPMENSYDEWLDTYAFVLQHGSEQAINRIEYGESQSRIYKSVGFTMPLLAIALSYWLYKAVDWKSSVLAASLCVLVTIASIIAFLLQRRNNHQLVFAVEKIIKKKK